MNPITFIVIVMKEGNAIYTIYAVTYMAMKILWKAYHRKNFYNAKREKLENFVNRIFPFFVRMEYFDKRSLDFFNKEYVWSSKNYNDSTYSTLTLTEIIDNDKEFVKNNSKLFDKEFLRNHPECM